MPSPDRLEQELYYLIARFLETGPCEAAARVLRQEINEHRLLPQRTDWENGRHDVTVEEMVERWPVQSDHLLRMCENLVTQLSITVPTTLPRAPPTLLGCGRYSVLRTKESVASKRPLRTGEYLHKRLDRRPLNMSTTQCPSLALLIEGSKVNPHRNMMSAVPISWYSGSSLYRRIMGHLQAVYCVLFDHTGRYIFTGADDHLVKIWSATDGRLRATLRGHQSEITDLSLSPDNSLLASGSLDKTIRVWCLRTLRPVAVLIGHGTTVTSLKFCPSVRQDKSFLSSTAQDGLCFWEYDRRKRTFQSEPRRFIDRTRTQVLCQSFSPGGTLLATGCQDHMVRIYQVFKPNESLSCKQEPERIAELSRHTDRVDSIQFANNDMRLISGSKDGTANIWSFKANRWTAITLKMTTVLEPQAGTAPNHTMKVNMVAWTRDDSKVLTTVRDHSIKVWNSYTGQLLAVLKGHEDDVYALECHPTDRRILYTGGHDGRVIIWDMTTSKAIKTFFNFFEGQGFGAMFDLKVSPNGLTFCATDSHGHLSIYGIGSGEAYQKVPVEQFFHTDYRPLIRDANHHVLDEQSQLAPHLLPPPFLVDIDGNPYPAAIQRLVPGRENCPENLLVPVMAQIVRDNPADGPEQEPAGIGVVNRRLNIDDMIQRLQQQQGEEQAGPAIPSNDGPRMPPARGMPGTPSSRGGMRRDGEVEGVRQGGNNWQQLQSGATSETSSAQSSGLNKRPVMEQMKEAELERELERMRLLADTEIVEFIREKRKDQPVENGGQRSYGLRQKENKAATSGSSRSRRGVMTLSLLSSQNSSRSSRSAAAAVAEDEMEMDDDDFEEVGESDSDYEQDSSGRDRTRNRNNASSHTNGSSRNSHATSSGGRGGGAGGGSSSGGGGRDATGHSGSGGASGPAGSSRQRGTTRSRRNAVREEPTSAQPSTPSSSEETDERSEESSQDDDTGGADGGGDADNTPTSDHQQNDGTSGSSGSSGSASVRRSVRHRQPPERKRPQERRQTSRSATAAGGGNSSSGSSSSAKRRQPLRSGAGQRTTERRRDRRRDDEDDDSLEHDGEAVNDLSPQNQRDHHQHHHRHRLSAGGDHSHGSSARTSSGNGNVREVPEKFRFPDWLTDTMPRRTPYLPQVGDIIMYFQQGHQLYCDAVRRLKLYKAGKHHQFVWNKRLREQEKVRVLNVRFELLPPRLCCVQVECTDPVDAGCAEPFWIRYHDTSDVIDFLVLYQSFQTAMLRDWKPGDRFRSIIEDQWWLGTITQHEPIQSEFPDSMFQCFIVRWDNGEEERMSPWDFEQIDHTRLPAVEGTGVDISPEEREAMQYVPSQEDFNIESRDAFRTRMMTGLDRVMGLAIAEPFLVPVDLNVYPDYAMIIAYPIDLTTIRSRLENNFYRRKEGIKFDITYVEYNANKFNEPNSAIVKQASLITRVLLAYVNDMTCDDPITIYQRLNGETVAPKGNISSDDSGCSGPSRRLYLSGSLYSASRSSPKKAREEVRRPTTRTTSNWRDRCALLIAMLNQIEDSQPFRQPVDLDEFQDYLEVVDMPMDLSTVSQKLTNADYATPEEFASDMQLIFTNSKNYNTNKRSRIYSMTCRLSAMFENEMRAIMHEHRAAMKRLQGRKTYGEDDSDEEDDDDMEEIDSEEIRPRSRSHPQQQHSRNGTGSSGYSNGRRSGHSIVANGYHRNGHHTASGSGMSTSGGAGSRSLRRHHRVIESDDDHGEDDLDQENTDGVNSSSAKSTRSGRIVRPTLFRDMVSISDAERAERSRKSSRQSGRSQESSDRRRPMGSAQRRHQIRPSSGKVSLSSSSHQREQRKRPMMLATSTEDEEPQSSGESHEQPRQDGSTPTRQLVTRSGRTVKLMGTSGSASSSTITSPSTSASNSGSSPATSDDSGLLSPRNNKKSTASSSRLRHRPPPPKKARISQRGGAHRESSYEEEDLFEQHDEDEEEEEDEDEADEEEDGTSEEITTEESPGRRGGARGGSRGQQMDGGGGRRTSRKQPPSSTSNNNNKNNNNNSNSSRPARRMVTESDDDEADNDNAEDDADRTSEGVTAEEETLSPLTRRSSRNKDQTSHTPFQQSKSSSGGPGTDRPRAVRTAARTKRIVVDEESDANDDALDDEGSRYGSPPSKKRRAANSTHQDATAPRGVRQQHSPISNGNGRRAKRHSSPQSDGASRASGRSSESGSGSSQSRRKAVTTLSTKTSPGQISDAGRVTRTKGRSHHKVDYREDPSDEDEFLDDENDDDETEDTVVTSSKGRIVKLRRDFTRALRDAR
ncbi:PH-interacting protein-like isoform X2 [Varroa destructor]|uniref:Bromo domain-containing protein n=1 Tax=Varroa destructor TaxID=109461 RepID=A0A7M7JUA3_VARDE|nr:PH-interacting protein-like isoform X2 [Varroa destructor]